MNDNNTRTFPRTLAEAFPSDRASCTEGWQRPNADRAVTVCLWIAVVAIVLSICFQGVVK